MEQAVEDGKLKSIGLSNYYTPEDFDRLVNSTSITPALLQNEIHPYHQSMEMKEHLQAGNIAIPGSGNEAHIQENYEIFDFELTDEEMERMSALDRNERFASY